MSTKTLEEFLKYNNEDVIDRVVKEEGWSYGKTRYVYTEMLKYLWLCMQPGNGGISPAPEVDIVWHNFILYTKDYTEFCNEYAGEFIHHSPFKKSMKKAEKVSGHNRTLEVYEKTFGKGSKEYMMYFPNKQTPKQKSTRRISEWFLNFVPSSFKLAYCSGDDGGTCGYGTHQLKPASCGNGCSKCNKGCFPEKG